MPYIDPEVIREAKRMDLLTYLQNYEPQELVRFSGSVYCTRTLPNLKISNGKWCLWDIGSGEASDGGRSALDYLVKIRGMKFTEAVEQIMGQAAIQPPVFIPHQKTPPKELVLPQKNRDMDRVAAYLSGRGIDAEIIRYCMDTGRLYESHPYHNAVFVGMDMDGTPKYAALRGLGTDFKGEATGSDKRYAFGLPALNEESDTVHFFEGAIDSLSYETLKKLDGKPFLQEYVWTLGGIYLSKKRLEESKLPEAILQFFKDRPHVKRAVTHFDRDMVGQAAAKTVIKLLPERLGVPVTDEPPPFGKDYNDCLCDRLGLPRTKPKERSHAR